MKKIVLILLLTLFVAITGCTDSKQSTKKDENINVLDKASPDLIQEHVKNIQLPSDDFVHLIGIDKNYYYFENNEAKQWQYLRVSRNDPNQSNRLDSINKNMDIKLQYGYKGDLYVGAMEWTSEKSSEVDGDYDRLTSPGNYRILKLSPGEKTEEVFSCSSMGFPSVVPAGDHIAIEINDGKHIELKILNIQTGKAKTMFQSDYKRDENGTFNGTILMGMDYANPAPSSTGICYQVCKLDNEPFDSEKAGENQFFFYDFKSGENKALTGHYRSVEYIGGTDAAFLTSDYPVDAGDHFVKLHLANKQKQSFQTYDFKKEDLEYGIMGSGLLNKDTMLAYNENGFYVIDLKNKSYFRKTYSTAADVMDKIELQQLDYQECVTGFAYIEDTFVFSISQGKNVEIHEITLKE